MMHCHACGKDTHPSIDINAQGLPVAMCATPDCGAAIGTGQQASATPDAAPPPNGYRGPDLVPERGPGPTQGPAKAKANADPIELARAELTTIDAELLRLADLQRRRRRLAAMVAAADAADADPAGVQLLVVLPPAAVTTAE